MTRSDVTMEAHWQALVTAALLGTDRRDPPDPVGPLADVVADTARSAPSERMLAHVAACTAVRRAGVLPLPATAPLAPPPVDDRPTCPPAAVDRWHHITASWSVLEDEWLLALTGAGWRVAPELAPVLLRRHRSDPERRRRALAAVGPLAPWLLDHLPDLGPAVRPAADLDEIADVDPQRLPELPIPPDLVPLLSVDGAESGGVLGIGIEDGSFGAAHRAVLVNLVARVRADALADLAAVLDAVDPHSPGHGLATALVDLATTRRRMLDELVPTS